MCFTWGAAEREPTDSMSRATFCFWSGFRKSVFFDFLRIS